jgi:hypothetical protein
VVPLLDLVLITMSPERNLKPSHLALSSSLDRYRTSASATPPPYLAQAPAPYPSHFPALNRGR